MKTRIDAERVEAQTFPAMHDGNGVSSARSLRASSVPGTEQARSALIWYGGFLKLFRSTWVSGISPELVLSRRDQDRCASLGLL